MRLYSIHLPPAWIGDRAPVAIREGFCWPAFFFTFLWAMVHRLWWAAIGIFTAAAALGAAGELAGIDPVSQTAVSLAFALGMGWEANDLRRRGLERAGFAPEGVVAAEDTEVAALRFLSRQAG